jgi:hypothetical protein
MRVGRTRCHQFRANEQFGQVIDVDTNLLLSSHGRRLVVR